MSLKLTPARAALLVLLPLVGLIIGLVLSMNAPKQYRSDSAVAFVAITKPNGPGAPNNYAEARAMSYRDVVSSGGFAAGVAASLGGQPKADEIERSVRVTVPSGTADMRIETMASDPATAERITRAYLVSLKERVAKTEQESARIGAATVGVLVMNDTSPAAEVPSNRIVYMAGGLLVGATLALALAMWWRPGQPASGEAQSRAEVAAQ